MTRPDHVQQVLVPDPVTLPETDGFWEGVRNDELRVARCVVCGSCSLREEACLGCGSYERAWVRATGQGRVKSFVVFHRGYHGYWATQVPYNVAVITLAEGPELLTNVIDCDPENLAVALPVEITFIDRGGHRAPVAVVATPP
jgi:uncharacterized OB-fold protein